METKALCISFLNYKGLLRPGHRSTHVSWTTGGRPTGSIGLEAIIDPDGEGYLLLSYVLASGEQHEYRVELARVASNLPGSTAKRYYLVCPVTGRRASMLYLHEGTELFAHRQAYPSKRLYYDSQLEQKRHRGLVENFRIDKRWEREYLGRKYRKTTYAGKETKWLTTLEEKTLRGRIATAQAILRLGPY